MPSPSKIKQDPPPRCRLKVWCARLSLTALPIYATTLFLIGSRASIDTTNNILSSTATTYPPHRRRGISLREKSHQQRNNSSKYQSIAVEIAAKWNLTSSEAPYLLEQQFYKIHDYNPRTDFLHFHHIPKTGGTSISSIINATIGALADGHKGILPGSGKSSPFEPKEFYDLTGISPPTSNRSDITSNVTEFPYLASYAHTRLRPIHGPNKTELASFFEEYFALPHNSQKRLRSLAMLREPMDLRASNQAMAMCALNGRVNTFNYGRMQKGLGRICTPEEGLNISALIDPMVDMAMAKCPNGIKRMDGKTTVVLDRYEKILCRGGRNAMDYCRSPSHLLRSSIYKSGMRSILSGFMGRYTAQQNMGDDNYISVERYLERMGLGFSVEKVEEYTLVDLGGLDSNNVMHAAYDGYTKKHSSSSGRIDEIDTNNNAEPDFLWFGTTERMKESTCLFYHTLQVRPLKRIPKARVMNCPTTSWWTEDHREEVKRREPADYAVWRTANAILDARVMKMREDIRRTLEDEEGLAPRVRDQYRALVDVGCLE